MLPLLAAQRDEGIDGGGAACGWPQRQGDDREEEQRDPGVGHRIARADGEAQLVEQPRERDGSQQGRPIPAIRPTTTGFTAPPTTAT